MALNYATVTGTFEDGSGNPLPQTGQAAYCLFTPSTAVYASGVPLITPAQPIQAPIINGALSQRLLATDNSGLTFGGLTGFFYWTVTLVIGGQASPAWSFFLPHLPSPVDLSALANTSAGGGFTGGTLTQYLAPAVATLTFGATIGVNAALGNVFNLTLTASTGTIANPTSPVDGQVIRFRIAQDATGGRTVAWGTAYDWGAGNTTPALSGVASKTDVLAFEYNAALSKWMYLSAATPQAF